MVTLNILRWGAPGGPRVLLLHGVQSSAATWWRIADGLAQAGAHVTAPDLRGHGASPQTTRYRFEDFAADLRALGTGWDLVAGHSLGATVAAFALAGDPAFARRAVLLDPVVYLPEAGFEDVVAAQLHELETADEARLADQHPHWHPEDRRLKAVAARACSPHAAEAVLRDNRPWDHERMLDALQTPTILLGGDPAQGALFAPTGDPRYRMLAGAGHSLHRDRPEQVLEVLAGCL